MASPNFDELHARFSRAIEDPVTAATAASDGDVSSASRSDYLNRSINEFVQDVYRLIGRQRTQKALQGMVDTQAITIASAGVSAETTYQNLPLEFVKVGSTNKYILRHSKPDLDNFRDVHIDYAYVIEAGKLYVYELGVIVNAGTGTFYHVGYRNDLVAVDAGGAGDTTLPKQFWDAVVELAVRFYYLDIGIPDMAKSEKYTATMMLLAKSA
jgi:hypothetical protein